MGATDKTFVDGSAPDLEAADLNGYNLEQKNLIEDAEQVFDDTDREQQSKAVSNLVAKGAFRGDSGAADAYVLEPTGNQLRCTSLMNGQSFIFQVGNTNTGASTVAVDGLTAKAIKNYLGNDVVAGDLTEDDIVKIMYDSVNDSFILLSNFTLESFLNSNYKTSTQSGDYAITDTDRISTLLFDDTSSDRTATLPTLADNQGRVITLKNISTDKGKVTVDGEGAETIDGFSTIDLDFKNATITVKATPTMWIILEQNITSIQKSYAPTITATNFTTTRHIATPYRDIEGNWFIKGVFYGTLSSTATNVTFNIGGVTFKNVANFFQVVSVYIAEDGVSSRDSETRFAKPNTDDIQIIGDGSYDLISCTYECELDSKPTFVE